MKAGCYLTLALLTCLVLLWHQYLKTYLDYPFDWVSSGVAGTATWLSIGALWNGWMLGQTVTALRRARDGLTPVDQRLAAVYGTIEPYRDPVIAPMSQKPCVIYEFELSRKVHRGKSSSQPVVDFCGIGMAPCHIQTGQQAIALYGFPEIDDFASANCPPGTREVAREYVQRTEWENFSGFGVIRGFGEMLGALTSTGEEIHRNFRMVDAATAHWLEFPEDSPEVLAQRRSRDDYWPLITEKRIVAGRPLTAMGIYDASAESLSTRPGTNFQRLRLLPGTVEEELHKASRARRSYFIGGVLAGMMIAAIAWGLLTIYCRAESTREDWSKQLAAAVLASDTAQIERQLNRGLEVDSVLNGQGATPLMLATSPEVVRILLQRGAQLEQTDEAGQTALHHAAQRQDASDIVQLLVDAGADAGTQRTFDQATPLDVAIRHGQEQSIAILQRAQTDGQRRQVKE